ncbi:hypothetical protein AbHV_ORF6 [Abalone herpesvirus Victoria/AUS/2009]|uniref:Uncharacterized protein n=1 Tax=Abalone herpesvirus (isolate Abalone/Australia/Victoria/2009) TaxID=1241371 RepID=K4JV12_ABHV|nr:hypothetical protein AbHV_ORF6 [Abalone herpesvirus Victoria/AUS/2009]AFU90016.1 hypothetical protein AbHV_ORF6 [Abalone herpesvirus Victoria/AUS/2009]
MKRSPRSGNLNLFFNQSPKNEFEENIDEKVIVETNVEEVVETNVSEVVETNVSEEVVETNVSEKLEDQKVAAAVDESLDVKPLMIVPEPPKLSLEERLKIFKERPIMKLSHFLRVNKGVDYNRHRHCYWAVRTCVICTAPCDIKEYAVTLCCDLPVCHSCSFISGYAYARKSKPTSNCCRICTNGGMNISLNYIDFILSEHSHQKTFTSQFLEGVGAADNMQLHKMVTGLEAIHNNYEGVGDDDVFLPNTVPIKPPRKTITL